MSSVNEQFEELLNEHLEKLDSRVPKNRRKEKAMENLCKTFIQVKKDNEVQTNLSMKRGNSILLMPEKYLELIEGFKYEIKVFNGHMWGSANRLRKDYHNDTIMHVDLPKDLNPFDFHHQYREEKPLSYNRRCRRKCKE